MATLYTHQRSNIQKTWFLMTMFLVIVIAIGFLLSTFLGNTLYIYAATGFALFMNIISYWFSDKIVLSMTGATRIYKEDNPELFNLVENLAIGAGLPMPKIYIVLDEAPNAFATGRSPERAVVAVTSGLLKILNRNELEGVLAHELSHIGNRDMLVMTVAVVLAGFVAMVADFFLRAVFMQQGENRNPVFIVLAVVGILLAPLGAQLIQLAISRKREFLADASGALLTRYPEGLASALEKISAEGKAMQHANHATAHLFIADPFGENTSSFSQKLSRLFQTHPPVEERIRLLRGMSENGKSE